MIGPGIIVPLVIVMVVVPIVYVVARRRLSGGSATEHRGPRAVPLTSAALHRSATAPWRVVQEVPEDRLGGVEHVLIGPPGVFAVVSVLEPLPVAPEAAETLHDPMELGRLAVLRGEVDDIAASAALPCDGVVIIHWGRSSPGGPIDIVRAPGVVAVDGHELGTWLAARTHDARLSPGQVDLVWRSVTTGIGRPDPLGNA